MNSYWDSFVSLIFPSICANCEQPLVAHEELLCLHCTMDLPKTNYHKAENSPILEQLKSAVDIDQAYAFLKFQKSGITQRLLHRLKYKGSSKVGEVLGKWFAREIENYITDVDILAPIPIHNRRRRIRGYNQAEVIAYGMSEILDIPIEDVLKRTRHVKTQTKKGKIDRWLDVETLYKMKKPGLAKEKHILLIDDVITTGATISVAVQALLDDGAASVSVACLATGK